MRIIKNEGDRVRLHCEECGTMFSIAIIHGDPIDDVKPAAHWKLRQDILAIPGPVEFCPYCGDEILEWVDYTDTEERRYS